MNSSTKKPTSQESASHYECDRSRNYGSIVHHESYSYHVDPTTLLTNNYMDQLTCIANEEEYDIPSNPDITVPLHCNSDLTQVMCTTNTEEFDIPPNPDYDLAWDCGVTYDLLTCTSVDGYTQYLNIGQPNCICQDCGAIMWYEERVKHGPKTNPRFSLCCSQGDIEILPYKRLPEPLHNLYHGRDKRSKYFIDNIRSFNSMFAFTSMGGNIDTSRNDGNAPPTFVLNGENYHHIASLLPHLLHNMNDPSFFRDRAILTPKNSIVDAVNDHILDLIPGDEKVYLSYDSPCSSSSNVDTPDDVHTPKFLNIIVTSGLPNHKLRLKVGVPVMLIKNMDQSSGMCNGTRLIITKLGRYVVEGKIISGSNIGDRVFIPRLSLIPTDKRLPFKFQRRQFPLSVSFAMTINKSKG
ncbi:hypothetical protein TSUD_279490 [Trifolium subterraneum]|uniref:DNA helicase Pif1-like 2B domain-containing protein n=1 Tax=Trifolium subterraneum TaxID=3900 RepID=A0A2Z6NBA4_TRISU|nr:hypothetical protein TSUD_279490 [Trifolium subterraneum]